MVLAERYASPERLTASHPTGLSGHQRKHRARRLFVAARNALRQRLFNTFSLAEECSNKG
jgi:hypothetical protein